MVESVRDNGVIVVAGIVMAAIAVWLLVDRWIARGQRRG
jgi:hypothetical protein